MTRQDNGQTIRDFGEQWRHFPDNAGFYGSLDLFKDCLEPLLPLDGIRNSDVIDIGSGTGRIVSMLLLANARHIVAVEPSDAFEILLRNTSQNSDRVTALKIKGEDLPFHDRFDYALSIGVLHHIVNPSPVVQAAHRSLRPGGKFFVWVYGREGNGLYLFLLHPLRLITTRLPHSTLLGFVRVIDIFLLLYMQLCRILPLPLKDYLMNVLKHFSPEKRRCVIYDQLNPTYAKYYSRLEIEGLMKDAGFKDVHVHQRYGYSYSVIGSK